MVGIMIVASIFLPSGSGSVSSGPPAFMIMGPLFIYPIVAVMVTADVAARGKESIFIYKKAPGGTRTYLKLLIARGYVLLVPLIGVTTYAMCYLSTRIDLWNSVLITGLVILMACSDVIVIIGLFLVNPAFAEKSPRFWLNIMLMAILHMACFVVSFLVLTKGGKAPDPITGLPSIFAIMTLLTWVAAAVFVVITRWKLGSIE